MKKMMKCYLALALGFVIAGCSKDSKDSKESSREYSEHSIVDSGHKGVQLWKNGPYWAETNIGAENPWDYGYYFWWGGTIGYKRVNDAWVASDGSSLKFSFVDEDTPTHGKDRATLLAEGWITTNAVLASKHDAAHVHWGGEWRMPTAKELKDLCDTCDWEKTTIHGINGYVVRGRGDYTPASIFFPCTGGGDGASLIESGSGGSYWSSVPESAGFNLVRFLFVDSGHRDVNYSNCGFGRSIRPVQGPAKKREQQDPPQ